MAQAPLNAKLQQELLLRLARGQSSNLAELARQIEVARPAVSRAVHTLAQNGLVEKADKAWQLTAAGIEQVEAVKAGLGDRGRD